MYLLYGARVRWCPSRRSPPHLAETQTLPWAVNFSHKTSERPSYTLGIDLLPEHQVRLLAPDVLACVFETRLVQVSNQYLQVGKPLHKQMAIIPGKVVKKYRDGPRSLQPEVTLRVEASRYLPV